ncbi:hypothetical protein EJ05DRAFT_463127 [Pseudovirgaria hyperparasitica]|uniref:Pre-rRNA processing protein n=1 Tax=Pseudovirgaria hyperparasitica TaxID=470096 RepID=A0A6A6WEZ9_9PEZI|nr:uncharacterized protein EJ05DRAFT_463127 [Pseudovirgaria hyperparasitica]KAF2759691.1 hypothetical protein EJ05DRAFT_463127 [Pseudovirgaria hyperparasitica]
MVESNDDATRLAGRPTSITSSRSRRSQRSKNHEETPLLARSDREDSDVEDDDANQELPSASRASAFLQSLRNLRDRKLSSSKKRRWPSLIALLVLFIVLVLVLVFGFIMPAAVKEYATQAVDFQPTRLSLVSLTETGVRVHVEGDFVVDASRVSKKSTRDFGRFGTWIAREVETGESEVTVYLPEYDNIPAGKAIIPSIKVNIRNGHVNHIDFHTIVQPGVVDGLRDVANDWLEGRRGDIILLGKAEVPLKSGIFSLGKQTLEQPLKIEGSKIPAVPNYDIARLDIHEMNNTSNRGGMSADATIIIENDFPVALNVPAVGFDVMVDGCTPLDSYITVGNASTSHLDIKPNADVHVFASGDVRELPHALTKDCPNSDKSPLDLFLTNYIHGEDSQIYINCCTFPDPDTPSWANDILKDIVVPLPFPGRTFDHLLKNFSLADVQFHLPEMWAEPGTPAAQPKISANIIALVGLPKEMNFRLDVGHVRADADIYYKHKKMGRLDLNKWQQAHSKRVDNSTEGPELEITSHVDKAPLEILDEDAFTEIVQTLLFGGRTLYLEVKASVDVQVDTPLGNITVQQLPAKGVVPVKPVSSGDGGMGSIRPQVGNLEIIDTDDRSVTVQARVNLTNPTNYSAIVPYVNINILNNDTILGHAIAENITVHPGNNTNLPVKAIWQPGVAEGAKGHKIGRELISQYLSGYNVTLTLQTHASTIPAQPFLGRLLSFFPITIPAPHLHQPPPGDDPSDDPDEDSPNDPPKFIRRTIMHIFSSSATFDLLSPFSSTTLYLTWLNATAFYHEEPAGKILYDDEIEVPPGLSTTPRLPVNWELGSVGFEAIRKALGGRLRLNATATVGVRIGEWEPRGGLWFVGRGIGAGVRP